MNKHTIPGFTAELSLGRSSSSDNWLSADLSRSLGGELIDPAAPFDYRQAMLSTFSAARYKQLATMLCKRNCYSNCIRNWPDSAAGCQSVAETCCLYDFHCSYCEP